MRQSDLNYVLLIMYAITQKVVQPEDTALYKNCKQFIVYDSFEEIFTVQSENKVFSIHKSFGIMEKNFSFRKVFVELFSIYVVVRYKEMVTVQTESKGASNRNLIHS